MQDNHCQESAAASEGKPVSDVGENVRDLPEVKLQGHLSRILKLLFPHALMLILLFAAIALAAAIRFRGLLSWTWFYEATPPLVAAMGIGTLAIAGRQSANRKLLGYWWYVPAVALYAVASLEAHSYSRYSLLTGAVIVLASAAVVRVLFERITVAWGGALAGLAGLIILIAASIDYNIVAVWYWVAIFGPLVVALLIGSNVQNRSAVIIMVIAASTSFAVLIVLGGMQCPAEGCSAVRPLDQAVDGLAATVSASIDPLVHSSAPPEFLLGPRTLGGFAAIYIYLCFRSLRFGRQRIRNVVDICQVDAEGEVTPTAPHEVRHILNSAAFPVGPAERGHDDTSAIATTALSSLVPGSRNVLSGVTSYLRKAPLRAMISKSIRGFDECSVAVVVDQVGSRDTRFALEVSRGGPFNTSPMDIAGYSILAYCLSARGMPSWSAWNTNGIGLASYMIAHERRRVSLRMQGEHGNLWSMAPQSTLFDDDPHDMEDELHVLEDVLRFNDPKSLHLMFEIASRYSALDQHARSVGLLTRAVSDYPQFPEAWMRLGTAYLRFAEMLCDSEVELDLQQFEVSSDQSSISAAPWDRRSIEVARGHPIYRRWANAALRMHSDRYGTDQCSEAGEHLPDSVRAIERWVMHSIDLIGKSSDVCPKEIERTRSLLVTHFTLMALVCAEESLRRVARPRLALRCLAVQSERVYFWPILMSRYQVRRLRSASVCLRIVAESFLFRLQGADSAEELISKATVMDHFNTGYAACEKEGAGWRAPWLLMQALQVALPQFKGEMSQTMMLKDRIVYLESLSSRRCRAEHGFEPKQLVAGLGRSI